MNSGLILKLRVDCKGHLDLVSVGNSVPRMSIFNDPSFPLGQCAENEYI